MSWSLIIILLSTLRELDTDCSSWNLSIVIMSTRRSSVHEERLKKTHAAAYKEEMRAAGSIVKKLSTTRKVIKER